MSTVPCWAGKIEESLEKLWVDNLIQQRLLASFRCGKCDFRFNISEWIFSPVNEDFPKRLYFNRTWVVEFVSHHHLTLGKPPIAPLQTSPHLSKLQILVQYGCLHQNNFLTKPNPSSFVIARQVHAKFHNRRFSSEDGLENKQFCQGFSNKTKQTASFKLSQSLCSTQTEHLDCTVCFSHFLWSNSSMCCINCSMAGCNTKLFRE